MDKDEKIGGVLYQEIVSSRRAYTAVELAGKVCVPEDKAREMLHKLCEIAIIRCIDDRYFPAEKVPQKDVDAESPRVEQCQTKKSPEDMQAEQPTPPAGLPVSLVTDSGGGGQQIVRRNASSLQCAVDPDIQRENEEILRKIIDVVSSEAGYMKSVTIAQKTGLGNSKGAVNRYLYFLREQNVLVKDEKTNFAMKKKVTEEDLKVLSAQLARKPQGKKNNSASSIDQSTECPCPNRGPACNHYHQHFHQNVTNVNVHVGDKILMSSDDIYFKHGLVFNHQKEHTYNTGRPFREVRQLSTLLMVNAEKDVKAELWKNHK